MQSLQLHWRLWSGMADVCYLRLSLPPPQQGLKPCASACKGRLIDIDIIDDIMSR